MNLQNFIDQQQKLRDRMVNSLCTDINIDNCNNIAATAAVDRQMSDMIAASPSSIDCCFNSCDEAKVRTGDQNNNFDANFPIEEFGVDWQPLLLRDAVLFDNVVSSSGDNNIDDIEIEASSTMMSHQHGVIIRIEGNVVMPPCDDVIQAQAIGDGALNAVVSNGDGFIFNVNERVEGEVFYFGAKRRHRLIPKRKLPKLSSRCKLIGCGQHKRAYNMMRWHQNHVMDHMVGLLDEGGWQCLFCWQVATKRETMIVHVRKMHKIKRPVLSQEFRSRWPMMLKDYYALFQRAFPQFSLVRRIPRPPFCFDAVSKAYRCLRCDRDFQSANSIYLHSYKHSQQVAFLQRCCKNCWKKANDGKLLTNAELREYFEKHNRDLHSVSFRKPTLAMMEFVEAEIWDILL